LEVVDDRPDNSSIIITSQLPVDAWHGWIGGRGTLADAILDRVLYSSHRIELKGESMRKRRSRQQGDSP
jgi:DNA replication protein DnaC